ncbi:MAG: holo-[acyl-carrier-protein] synthase [Gemmatimonadetes bacterium]|nr:MAG: holo-[acyl-carrier-protein] synthase [Gemmatimonadota bacterium]GDX86799.1 holo-[acyl-carrier-protein] synthase [Gemmatimonadota bacterium]
MIVGVGIDLVDIARVQRLIDGKGQRALDRLFTADEVAYATSRARPAMHLAARIAAKEAAFKALSGSDEARRIGWREVEVIAQSGGAPRLELHGRAQLRARELGVGRAHLSLSHTDTTAGAVVVLDRGGD